MKVWSEAEQSAGSAVDAHEWLIDRLATVEAEQRTRLGKKSST